MPLLSKGQLILKKMGSLEPCLPLHRFPVHWPISPFNTGTVICSNYITDSLNHIELTVTEKWSELGINFLINFKTYFRGCLWDTQMCMSVAETKSCLFQNSLLKRPDLKWVLICIFVTYEYVVLLLSSPPLSVLLGNAVALWIPNIRHFASCLIFIKMVLTFLVAMCSVLVLVSKGHAFHFTVTLKETSIVKQGYCDSIGSLPCFA